MLPATTARSSQKKLAQQVGRRTSLTQERAATAEASKLGSDDSFVRSRQRCRSRVLGCSFSQATKPCSLALFRFFSLARPVRAHVDNAIAKINVMVRGHCLRRIADSSFFAAAVQLCRLSRGARIFHSVQKTCLHHPQAARLHVAGIRSTSLTHSQRSARPHRLTRKRTALQSRAFSMAGNRDCEFKVVPAKRNGRSASVAQVGFQLLEPTLGRPTSTPHADPSTHTASHWIALGPTGTRDYTLRASPH